MVAEEKAAPWQVGQAKRIKYCTAPKCRMSTSDPEATVCFRCGTALSFDPEARYIGEADDEKPPTGKLAPADTSGPEATPYPKRYGDG
ncbi:hypothetical protein AB0I81_54310 [Nonomuraea sp. NPDC050404]|uniref:hypothetical protein n=1 Tax=Nonomuraea sp. NPDC050404 TaxID=3155783 RepID=UPI0034086610